MISDALATGLLGCVGPASWLQSAYRANRSTETAVLKVLPDILLAVDAGDLSLSALVLLDLSVAFDTVDHESIFFDNSRLPMASSVLQWFRRGTARYSYRGRYS